MSNVYITTSATVLPLNKWIKSSITTPTDGSATAFGGASVHAQKILVRANDDNATDVQFGPTSDADFETLRPGVTYEIEAPHLQKISLGDWFVKSVTNGIAAIVKVLYV